MKTILKLFLVTAALGLAGGAAQAQQAPANPAPAASEASADNSIIRHGGDTIERDVAVARDAAIAKQREASRPGAGAKPTRSVPAKPEEVTIGSEVRDTKGVLIGTVESVSMAAAVLKYDTGKVEVPLEAFGKNNKGLMIGMTKADFMKAVADANKPAG